MRLRRFCAAAASLALFLVSADGATPEKDPYSGYQIREFSFSSLRMLADRVTDIRADVANRVWLSATGLQAGAAAVDGRGLADFFPLTSRDGLVGPSVAAVAFGPLDGQENFFLGFSAAPGTGIQYGRVLADTGLSPKPPARLLSSTDTENLVFGLASDGARSLWAATQGGLVWWTLGDKEPTRRTPDAEATLRRNHAVRHVAADPWAPAPHVVFSDDDDGKLCVLPQGTAPENEFYSVAGVQALTFDQSQRLWVAAGNRIYRFVEGDPTDPYRASPSNELFDVSFRTIRSIAVDDLNADGTVVWVGTDRGAYFRRFDEGLGQFVGEWLLANTGSSDADVRVYLDPSGNLWLGSDFGVRALLSRLLTLNSNRFVGYGANATVTLVDVNPDPGNPAPATLPVYVVPKGGAITSPELTLTATRGADGVTYTASFGFATATDDTRDLLGVSSSANDVAFEVVYAFGLPGARNELPRAGFTWGNVAPFDDDLWVGNPCFVKSLGR